MNEQHGEIPAMGNNRARAAELLGKSNELIYNKVDFPVEGTSFKTPQDVLEAST